jgi:uncharacterized protein
MVAPAVATAVVDGERLLAWFTGFERVVVAFSGGVDSALVLAGAVRALGPHRVEAVTAVSPSLAEVERAGAAETAARLGAIHRWVTTDEMTRPAYRRNDTDRCFHCKASLLDALRDLPAAAEGAAVCTGTNADDVVDPYRPGIRAAAERGARTPLADLGLTKDRVRAVARLWGVSVAAKPATACLASRIAHGSEVTATLLQSVDRAEVAVRRLLVLRGHPARDLRVRVLPDRVRIELDPAALRALDDPAERLLAVVRRAGLDRPALDTAVFRSGGLHLLPG